MGKFRAAILAASVMTAGPAVLLADDAGNDRKDGFITREWTWIEGASMTTMSVYGPADQVNAFDPRGSHLTCKDCELMSSIQSGPIEEAVLNEAAGTRGSLR